MAMKNKLSTREGIMKWASRGKHSCVFSRNCIETIRLCLISNPYATWDDLLDWRSSHLKGKALTATIIKLAWWATVYHLCLKSNAIVHAEKIRAEQIVKSFKKDIKPRVEGKGSYCDSIFNYYAVIGAHTSLLCTWMSKDGWKFW